MSGHSKWSTIKHQKAIQDQKRGQVFTKLATAISFAVRQGGGITDPDSNFKLRLAIDTARAANMPKENIERAIDRGAGKGKDAQVMYEMVYEGFGPDGVGVIMTSVTDNKNRTQSMIKNVFSKHNGTSAQNGAVIHFFEHVGIITIPKTYSYDDVFTYALEAEALDVEDDGEQYSVYTDPHTLHDVLMFFKQKEIAVSDGNLGYRPRTTVALQHESEEKLIQLLEALEELDDVQQVFTNADFSTHETA